MPWNYVDKHSGRMNETWCAHMMKYYHKKEQNWSYNINEPQQHSRKWQVYHYTKWHEWPLLGSHAYEMLRKKKSVGNNKFWAFAVGKAWGEAEEEETASIIGFLWGEGKNIRKMRVMMAGVPENLLKVLNLCVSNDFYLIWDRVSGSLLSMPS